MALWYENTFFKSCKQTTDIFSKMTFLKVDGQESEVVSTSCNEHGVMELEFNKPHGPIYHHEVPTNVTFGDQEHFRDPLDKKYVVLKNSDFFENAGEGAFAKMDVPTDTVFALYGGLLFDKEESEIFSNTFSDKIEKYHWTFDDPDYEAEWKYRSVT